MKINVILLLSLIFLTGCSYNGGSLALVPNGTTINVANVENSDLSVLNKDSLGHLADIDVFGYSKVSVPCDIVVMNFQFNIPENHIKSFSSGSGSTYTFESKAFMEVGAGSGYSSLESIQTMRYHSGHESFALFTVDFDEGVDGLRQNAGLKSGGDGFYLCKEGTEFGVCHSKGYVETRVTSFNGVDTSSLIDENLNIYRFTYGWLGIAPLNIEVFLDGEWKKLHSFDFSNKQESVSILNPNLPLFLEINKTSTDSNTYNLSTGSWNLGFMDGVDSFICDSFFTYLSYNNEKTIPANTLTNIVSFKMPETYFGKLNTIRGSGLQFSFSTDGNKPVDILLCGNEPLTGANFINLSYNISPTQIDTSGTVSGCSNEAARFKLSGIDSQNIPIEELGLQLLKGQTYTISALSKNVNDVSVSVRWKEER